MKDLFITLLDMLDGRGEITEASFHKNSKYARISVELKGGDFSILISKEDETDGNNRD